MIPPQETQQLVLAIASRTAGCISLVSSSYMAFAAFRQRRRVYHRLMLGLTIHLVNYSIWIVYGSAAVPVGTMDALGARGNTQTCTAQGFFLHVTMAGFLYYVFMSLYSFQAVRNNFKVEKYNWIEKWIHIGVHVYPLLSAFYLLSIEAFNYTGGYICWIASKPVGCGETTGIECERGPQNHGAIVTILAGLPYIFILVFPTILMVALYCEVRRKQSSIRIQAKVVAKQAGLYLLALYMSFLFSMIDIGMQRFSNKRVFLLHLLANVTSKLVGFWMLMIYLYFRVTPPKTQMAKSSRTTHHDPEPPSEGMLTFSEANQIERTAKRAHEASSFNIFDGTNAGGAFADFVYDAESDDEREDTRESVRWDHDVQNHI